MNLDICGEGIPSYILRETSSLRDLQSPYIAELLDIVIEQKYIYLVFEYMRNDLLQYLYKPNQVIVLPELYIKRIMHQILKGVQYCHSRNIMHRDLKPANILIEPDYVQGEQQTQSQQNSKLVVKITDFGLSRVYSMNTNTYTDNLVTIWYRAPEILVSTQYTQAVDLWSAGCIMGELICSQPLFQGDCDIDQLDKIFQKLGSPSQEEWQVLHVSKDLQYNPNYQKGQLFAKMPQLKRISQDGQELLLNLLAYDPSKRYTAKQALQSPFFQGL